MDVLKHFLDAVCVHSGNEYRYDQVENLAEVYRTNDALPISLVEWNSSLGHFIVKFRIGMSSLDIAKLTRDMATQDSCLIFDEDFIVDPDKGYLYGEEATQAFVQRIQNNIEQANIENAMDGAVYISHKPIFAFGSNIPGKTKLERLWDLYDDDPMS